MLTVLFFLVYHKDHIVTYLPGGGGGGCNCGFKQTRRGRPR